MEDRLIVTLSRKMKVLQALLMLSVCAISCVVKGMKNCQQIFKKSFNPWLLLCLGKSIGDTDVSASKADPIEFTHFNLWTRNNPVTLQELFIGDAASLAASNFDASKPTKVFAHGWRMNGYDNNAVFSLRDRMISYSFQDSKNNVFIILTLF